MTEEEKEESKKFYESNKDGQSEELTLKVRLAMLEIVKLKDINDGFTVFEHLLTNFSKLELAHLGCLYIGSQMVEMLNTSPEFKLLCSMMATLERVDEKK